jgi:hypothetical protein
MVGERFACIRIIGRATFTSSGGLQDAGQCLRQKGCPCFVLDLSECVLMDSTFGLRTCDILGTIELGDIAWQCDRREGYHVSADAVIVEYLRDGRPVGPGEEGRIVCTSLYGYTMPLIRYAAHIIGDIERAREVVQDTFLKLCHQRPAQIRTHLTQWLYTVCRNRALDVRRKERRMTAMTRGSKMNCRR